MSRLRWPYPEDWLFAVGCLGTIVILALYLWMGYISTQYLAVVFLHHRLTFWPALAISFFFGEITVPAAVLVWLCVLGGVRF